MLNHQFRPITTAALKLKESEASHTPLPIEKQDEVGELIGGFNHLLGSLQEREQALIKIKEQYETLFHKANDGIMILNLEGKPIAINEAYARMHGYDNLDELLALTLDEMEPWLKDNPQVVDERIQYILSKGAHTFEVDHFRKDGQSIRLEVSASIVVSDVEPVIQSFHRDITERTKLQKQLEESEFRWKFAIDGSGDGLWDWDITNNTAFFTQQFRKMLGHNDLAYTVDGWTNLIHPDDREETLSKIQGFITGLYPSFSHEHRLLCASGLYIWVTNRASIVSRNEKGDASRIIGTIRNITHRREQEDAIKALAFYDPLTKLPNRRLFDDRLAQCMTMSKRNNTYAVLMFLDLDNFKALNDTYGHSVGDMLLVEAAHRLRNCVRETDTVARFGGDEFTVIVNDAGKTREEAITHANLIAEKIRDVVSVPYELIQTDKTKPESIIKHQCNVSIGYTAFINHEAVQEDIVKWADTAMYDAKENGTNLIRYFDDHKDK
jgi:diguanylate cyclase (GGDEF)-like protein/PAS domain S-box-containing protein